ncbi:hypothetical protein C8R43DRAFT_948752 [Mycena crocata]|nr:hypothetical protein C8R43DRAFT_948752 [Mycena crocata]
MLEIRQIEAQAQLYSIRDRFPLEDDDLAFEAEMELSEEAMVWASELETLKEEHRRMMSCIEHSEKHSEQYSRIRQASPTATEIEMRDHQERRERRQGELRVDITNSDVKTWVSEAWDAAMESLLDLAFPGDLNDAADEVSMDLGYDDDEDEDQDQSSPDALKIVCERSFARGDPLEAQWDALTKWMWQKNEMPAGVRHSIEMAHAFRRPKNAQDATISEHADSANSGSGGSSGVDAHERLAGELD